MLRNRHNHDTETDVLRSRLFHFQRSGIWSFMLSLVGARQGVYDRARKSLNLSAPNILHPLADRTVALYFLENGNSAFSDISLFCLRQRLPIELTHRLAAELRKSHRFDLVLFPFSKLSRYIMLIITGKCHFQCAEFLHFYLPYRTLKAQSDEVGP